MSSLESILSIRLAAAFEAVAGHPVDPMIARSAYADFQANGALSLARTLQRSPRDVAAQALAAADLDGLASGDVAGPGFINLTITPSALWTSIAELADDDRLGIEPSMLGQRVVVEYSGPNVAKEMHVGHLRSTVIGDAIARTFEFLGADVVRQNHVGDWGTQFGMLIAQIEDTGGATAPQPAEPGVTRLAPESAESGVTRPAPESAESGVTRLTAIYRAARARFDSDPEFVARSRARLVDLQAGDPAALAIWTDLTTGSMHYFASVYELLGIDLRPADTVGESFYNPVLPDIAAALAALGLAVESAGALCVFVDGVRAPDGSLVPLIVRKSDGGFGYAATDLAAIRHRVDVLRADRICYVVDARQALHFRMVFSTAREASWLCGEHGRVHVEHVPFGTVLGTDGKPFKTRSGDTASLIGLLTAAVDRAALVIAEKNPDLRPDEVALRAREVGIGAIKYADLCNGRTRDYVFDLDRMVSLSGNTGVYLQYAHARVRSILRKAGAGARPAHVDGPLVPAERRLAIKLDEFAAAVAVGAEAMEPHRLCGYLFELAQALTAFYDACPVLGAPDPAVRANRLVLCGLTARTFQVGLGLLGIAAPNRL